MANEQQYNLNW